MLCRLMSSKEICRALVPLCLLEPVSGTSRKAEPLLRGSFSLLSLNGEETVVFVAVFGEPQGVAGRNKQNHCHGSQM